METIELFTKVKNKDLFTVIEKKLVKQLHISDIHFGAMDPEYQYNILKNNFIKELYNDKYDLVCINGDLFHKTYMAGSKVIYYTMKFMDDLVNYCEKNNTTLILLQGTNSHDGNQLQLFYHYSNRVNLDLRIIRDCCIIEAKGLRILCIPEMYNMGEDYYLKLLNQYSDLAICHCVLGDLLPMAKINSQGLNSHAPIFDIEHFRNVNLVMSGHIHNPLHIGNFYYCGSPYSWIFGEELIKGFYKVYQYNTGQYSLEFIPIEDSKKYITINIDSKILTNDPDDIVKYIKEYINDYDNYRIEITVATPNIVNKIKILRKFFGNIKNIKLKVNNIDKFEEVKKDGIEEMNDAYSFLLNSNFTPFEIISKFILREFKQALDANEIENIIKNDGKNTKIIEK